MSLTKDVRPGQVKKSLNAFRLEAMLPDKAFAGSDKNKLGPKAHLKGKMKRPARQGDLVGEQRIAEAANVNPQFIIAQITKILAGEARRMTNAPMAQLLAPVMKEYGLTLQQIDGMVPGGLKKAAAEYGIMMKEGWSDAMVARRTGQPRTPYSVYIKGKKWKDFENDDHAEAVANKLKAKFKADGRDPSVITIAPTDILEAISKKDLVGQLQKDLPKVTDPKNKNARPVAWTGPGKDDYGYTGYQGHGMPTDKQERDRIRADKKKGVAEEKQKGVDGKACWKGYKRMGTKKKGGKTVDNCVKIGESYERKIASLIEQLKKK
jgi:hypothetical protein